VDKTTCTLGLFKLRGLPERSNFPVFEVLFVVLKNILSFLLLFDSLEVRAFMFLKVIDLNIGSNVLSSQILAFSIVISRDISIR
jgi:hypothetical protein